MLIENNNFNINDLLKKEVPCNGTVFKASVRHFKTSDDGFCFKVILKPVKKKSCKGCENCGWQHEGFAEVGNNWPIIGIESCEDGELYTIVPCNETRDIESGIIDEWDIQVLKFEE